MPLLAATDPAPCVVERPGAASPWLIVCDHAGRATPAALGDLGLPCAEWARHIAWDIGALGLARALAARLGGATLIWQPYSRLVIDCNRDPGRADAIVTHADGADIPGNLELSPQARAARVAEVHAPYHAAIAGELAARLGRGERPALVLVHSFTAAMGGVARPWQVGVLHQGNRLSRAALAGLGRRPDLCVGDNAPYAMDEVDFTAPTHAQAGGLEYLELETRQDLIGEAHGQDRFATLYAQMLTELRD